MSPPRRNARGRKRNRGHFRKGHDPRRRVGFTREECRKGYRAAKAAMDERGWEAAAWFLRHIRGFYRRKKREAPAALPIAPCHPDYAAHDEPPY